MRRIDSGRGQTGVANVDLRQARLRKTLARPMPDKRFVGVGRWRLAADAPEQSADSALSAVVLLCRQGARAFAVQPGAFVLQVFDQMKRRRQVVLFPHEFRPTATRIDYLDRKAEATTSPTRFGNVVIRFRSLDFHHDLSVSHLAARYSGDATRRTDAWAANNLRLGVLSSGSRAKRKRMKTCSSATPESEAGSAPAPQAVAVVGWNEHRSS